MATKSGMKKDELGPLIKILIGMLGDKATSIHLHKTDYETVKASPAAFGLTLSNKKDIVAAKDGRLITVRPIK
jgi:hypothetical protein